MNSTQYTMKDLLLSYAGNQKDEKPHTKGLNDTAIPHVKIKITEIPLDKTESPHDPSRSFSYLLLPRVSFLTFNGGISIHNGQ